MFSLLLYGMYVHVNFLWLFHGYLSKRCYLFSRYMALLFSGLFCLHLLYMFWYYETWHIKVLNHVFLVVSYEYEISLILYNAFLFEFYFVWYQYCFHFNFLSLSWLCIFLSTVFLNLAELFCLRVLFAKFIEFVFPFLT